MSPASADRLPEVRSTPPGDTSRPLTVSLPAGPFRARVLATGVAEGDLAIGGEPLALTRRRREVLDRPWVWLDQVHGAGVVVLGDDDPVESLCGRPADAVVSRRTDVVLAVHTADCVPVAFVSSNGVIAAAHAGWRGLLAGVLPATVAKMRELGANRIRAVVGPCIGVECYEFGEADLQPLVGAFGPSVAGRTSGGRPALDLRAAVRASVAAVGVDIVSIDPRCTACGRPGRDVDPGGQEAILFSHRARGDSGRQALLVWLEVEAGTGTAAGGADEAETVADRTANR